MIKFFPICLGLVLLMLGTACDRNASESAEPSTPAAPAAESAARPAASPTHTGTVLETMDSGGYTYMLVKTPQGVEKWAAVPQAAIKEGEEVTFYDGGVMTNFASKTLGRTFPEIIFSAGLVKGAAATPVAQPAGGADSFMEALGTEADQGLSAAGSNKAIVPHAELKVDKAPGENSYTIGEIFEKATELDGRNILVRGQVMKVSLNIMGKNWIHLQDGSGSAANNTHDLVLTSDVIPENGQVVTMAGVLHANKDFGAGYVYTVILEEAKILN